ncbi:phosphoglycerol transferase MdoB-like AlkP superfamily enzyme [Clostridium moniliforme]|uniref:Phosphoglycerol transferase MdoB-like AlkP superfamily enzyme n=1 Tax=Clostridium moniliforme TaxID=39489 RepID=A0ABS4F3K4_9CLOT|nr:LTA synthase family protein [Clostridium moniliforme]MBP1890844.1 phosphoglycerol transferase MdoB-like AlkP superfamily enzyme [Clostridium moniliforme]
MKFDNILNYIKRINIGFATKLLVFIILALKTLAFMAIGASNTGRSFLGWGIHIDNEVLLAHISFLLIMIVPALFFKGKRQFTYLIIIDCLFSLLLLADLWYYRASRNYLGLRHIFFRDMFNPLNQSLINPSILDLLFIIDIPILILIRNKSKSLSLCKRHAKSAIGVLVVCVAIIYGTHYLFDVKNITDNRVKFMNTSWSPFAMMQDASPLGYHLGEAAMAIEKYNEKPNEDEMKQVDNWLDWNNKKLPDNKYKGIFKGKNVIFMQIESLENFVIGKKVYGQEITPNLNKLINKSFYFDNFYEQNNAGNSIDCDMMVSSGMLTLGDSITFLTHPEVKYPSLPRNLLKNGYTVVSTHAERAGDWNWSEAHANALGINKMWDIASYKLDDVFGMGLSDRSFYSQYADKLKTLKEPFFSTIPSLSSHGPFDLPDRYRELKLPKVIDDSKLGGYFQSVHYADKQIGFFINKLNKLGLMKNTVLVIYGDHTGVHKYYNNEIQNLPLPGTWWKKVDHKIPLFIYATGMKGETINTPGGQSDITPTILYLLGINTNDKFMGRNLLNTDRDATVIKGNKVIGNPTPEQREQLEKAYKIADYMIKNRYFENRGLVN